MTVHHVTAAACWNARRSGGSAEITAIEDDVRGVVATVVPDPADRPVGVGVTLDAPLGPDGLDLDSLAIAELANILEEEFQILIPDRDLNHLAAGTVADLARYVAGLRAA